MSKGRKAAEIGFCRLQLQPDPNSATALRRTLDAHAALLDWLDLTVPPTHSHDLVAIHRKFYEAARAKSGLQARAVTLAFKDWVQRRRGKVVDGLPLDEKLYGIKGVDAVSVATLNGRITIPFRVAGYGVEWNGSSPARLMPIEKDSATKGFELLVATGSNASEASILPKEDKMHATDTALSRIGRVIAGMANSAVDAVEGVNPEATIEQSLREIDAAAAEIRAELGNVTAERFRLETRQGELLRENEELEHKIQSAIESQRDELAEVGIARQMDIEAQSGVLQRLIGEADAKIAEFGQTMDAVAASRREAEDRLRAFKASQAAIHGDATPAARNATVAAMAKVARAKAVGERLTGVPSGPDIENTEALRSLDALVRDKEIKSRLARLKSTNQN